MSAKAAGSQSQFESEFQELSHAIRNPLNVINGYAELLLMNGGLSPASAEQVRAILASSQTLIAALVAHLDSAEASELSSEARPALSRSIFKNARRVAAKRPYHRFPKA